MTNLEIAVALWLLSPERRREQAEQRLQGLRAHMQEFGKRLGELQGDFEQKIEDVDMAGAEMHSAIDKL